MPPPADHPDAVRELTQRCTDVLEMYVRRYPNNWLWMHRRWRDLPRGEDIPGMFPAARAPRGMTRVVVRAPNWLGDIVMALPAIAAVRAAHPGAHLAVAAPAPFADVCAAVPGVDGVVPLRGSGIRAIGAHAEALAAGRLRSRHPVHQLVRQRAGRVARRHRRALGLPPRLARPAADARGPAAPAAPDDSGVRLRSRRWAAPQRLLPAAGRERWACRRSTAPAGPSRRWRRPRPRSSGPRRCSRTPASPPDAAWSASRRARPTARPSAGRRSASPAPSPA